MSDANVAEYLNLQIEGAAARLRAVNQVVRHPTSKGDVGEDILRDIIRRFLPAGYEVSSGFIVELRGDTIAESKQIDVLVYDRGSFVPLYQDQGLVVVTPAMVKLAIESKFVLNRTQLGDSLSNVESVKDFSKNVFTVVWAYQGMTIETLKKHLPDMLEDVSSSCWPDQIFNLQRNYLVSRRREQNASTDWTVYHGKSYVARSFFQTILYCAKVENLRPLIMKIEPEKHESF